MFKGFFDAHCDTGSECMENNFELRKNPLHLDFERMERYDGYIQVFAAFVDKNNISCSPLEHCLSVLSYLRNEITKNQDIISLITSNEILIDVSESGKAGAILSIEGGEALQGSLENLSLFYQMGVRLITLTWNYSNEIADGVTECNHKGLTEFGKVAVSAMEDMGIVIDVSHLSESAFWAVAEYTKYPFVASHSNVKALCLHPRNLSDEQIECIANRKGCVGINFYPQFLNSTGKADVSDIRRHIEYLRNLAGDDCVGFGSDFDGISYLPEGMQGVESMKKLFKTLKNSGYSEAFLEKLRFGNFYRIFYNTMSRRT